MIETRARPRLDEETVGIAQQLAGVERLAPREDLAAVDPLDAGAVAAALERLLADPDLRRRMGAAARARAERSFAYDTLAARLTPLAQGDLSVLAPVGGRGPARSGSTQCP